MIDTARWPLAFDQPWWLLLLPLALLPWWRDGRVAHAAAALRWWPDDAPSRMVQAALRAAASLALALMVLAAAGPFRPEAEVERVGVGAEIAIVLDRSRSMDQGFAGLRNVVPPGLGGGGGGGAMKPETIDAYMRLHASRGRESKAKVSRELLAEFARRRTDDRFAMIGFSTAPIRVLDFTGKPEIIQAAISAGEGSRGVAETDIGRALDSALDLFEDRPYTGSRLILLVSDGGDHIEPAQRQRIADRARRHRVGIAWIYLRATNAPGLFDSADSEGGSAEGLPEIFLHRMFGQLGVRYKAYEADHPEALKAAIDDLGRLENLPLTYIEHLPRREFAPAALWLALALVALLLAAQALQRSPWRVRSAA